MLRTFSMLLSFTMPIVFDPLAFAGTAAAAVSAPTFGQLLQVRGIRVFPPRIRPAIGEAGHVQDANPYLDTG